VTDCFRPSLCFTRWPQRMETASVSPPIGGARYCAGMSRENVEVVRLAIEANRSGDVEASIEALLALSDPSIQYTRVTAAVDPQTYRGHDGIRHYFADMADSWQEWRIEAEEVLEVRPNTLVATVRFHGIGKDRGVPIEARLGAVFVLSEGKLVRGQVYSSREDALAAVGVRESDSLADG
jgi:ketosteroid isomerase-like protein